jgi:FkbM family methyltransferase
VLKQVAILLRRLARMLADGPVDVRHWGLRLRLLPSGNISEGIFLFMPARWDRLEREFLARHLRPGDRFVDIGANAGGYLWWVERVLGPDWRGLAVEPDPALRARLAFNLATNEMSRIEVVPAAVGPKGSPPLVLRLHPENRGENALVEPDEHHALTEADGAAASSEADKAAAPTRPDTTAGPTEADRSGSPVGHGPDLVEVRVVALPELIREARLDRVDVLKIDVEGLEADVLLDFLERAPETLLPRVILTELRDTPAHRAALERARTLGYTEQLSTRLNTGLVRVGSPGKVGS